MEQRVIFIEDIDINKFNVKKCGKNCVPLYGYSKMVFDTGYFKLTHYGISSNVTTHGVPIKLPLDNSQIYCNIIKDKLRGIDKYMINNKHNILSNYMKKNLIDDFEYIPCVKKNKVEYDDYSNFTKCDYWNAWLNYDSDEYMTTTVRVKENDNNFKIENDNDIATYMNYRCDLRMIICVDGICVVEKIKKYYLKLKILCMKIVPHEKLFSNWLTMYASDESEDEETKEKEKYMITMDDENFIY